MAFRTRRRTGRRWSTFAAAFLVVVAIVLVARQPVEAQIGRLIAKVEAVVTPTNRPSPAAGSDGFAVPTFTVSIDRSEPLANVPPPDVAANRFLSDWVSNNYSDIYDLVSQDSRAGQSRDQFVQRYQTLMSEASILSLTA
ncbi:MAG TPA: NTF2-like N-terminal transpeptidase domain-containing protein, partial [Chloroflexota bacterium]|nr:NTF2-like N-terminal transpeptidase domain-containing protein [Chloroflexota bacterium]